MRYALNVMKHFLPTIIPSWNFLRLQIPDYGAAVPLLAPPESQTTRNAFLRKNGEPKKVDALVQANWVCFAKILEPEIRKIGYKSYLKGKKCIRLPAEMKFIHHRQAFE